MDNCCLYIELVDIIFGYSDFMTKLNIKKLCTQTNQRYVLHVSDPIQGKKHFIMYHDNKIVKHIYLTKDDYKNMMRNIENYYRTINYDYHKTIWNEYIIEKEFDENNTPIKYPKNKNYENDISDSKKDIESFKYVLCDIADTNNFIKMEDGVILEHPNLKIMIFNKETNKSMTYICTDKILSIPTKIPEVRRCIGIYVSITNNKTKKIHIQTVHEYRRKRSFALFNEGKFIGRFISKEPIKAARKAFQRICIINKRKT